MSQINQLILVVVIIGRMARRHSKDTGENDTEYPQLERRQIVVPQKGTFVKEIKSTLKETFFPDNPLRTLRKQTPNERFFAALAYIFPVFHWGQGYTLLNLKDDVIAGLTIGSLCIPQDIGYAKLAGVPPIYGLCMSLSFLFAPLVYVYYQEIGMI